MSIARIAALLLALQILCACANLDHYDPPSVDLVGLAPLGSASGQQGLAVKLRVVNPNSRNLNIKGLYYEIMVEGHKLLNGASNAAALIPAYGENVIAISATPNLSGVVGLLHTLASSGLDRDHLRYSLRAKLSLGGVPMPVRLERTGELSLSPEMLGIRATP